MTTELQTAAVELQQIEAKRAELLPDDVREAMFDLQHDWELRPSRAASYDTIRSHIAALEVENKRLREYHRASEATRPSYQAVSDSWAARDDITKAALAEGAKK
jgi:hypothetical protein